METKASAENTHHDHLPKDLKEGYGWVMYRLPGSKEIIFLVGETTEERPEDESFAVSSFVGGAEKAWHIIPQVRLVIDDANSIPILEKKHLYHLEEKGESTPFQHYCGLVSEVIKNIEEGHLLKAVPARTKHIALPDSFSLFTLYNSLLDTYPNAFVYVLSTPPTGTWTGCSPELLFRARGNEIETLSLAGTKKNTTLGSTEFSNKEWVEQQLVTQYIQTILEKYCEPIDVHGPILQQAGNVQHLATRFKAVLRPENNGNYGLLINDLHPTPAVCGLPLEASKKMLAEHEGFDRALYSGYLGPISKTSADLYVNLRCMQVFENSSQLYAGAGVVQGSVPEKEWEETEEKMLTIGRFLGH